MLAQYLPPWFKDAECGTVDPALFWPDEYNEGSPPGPGWERFAQKVCNRCPVRRQCDDYAAEIQDWAVWGGQPRKPKNKNLVHQPGGLSYEEEAVYNGARTPNPQPNVKTWASSPRAT